MDVDRYSLVSDQVTKTELKVILRELQKVLKRNLTGDVVEFGCYVGTTSLFLQRALAGTRKTLHAYDSFAGLPQKTAKDMSPLGTQYVAAELAAPKARFIKNFQQARLPLPVIHKGWFADLTKVDLPQTICFAYLDGDFYESIRDSLRLVWPQLVHGAAVIVDDYQHPGLPGVRQAVDEWLQSHQAHLKVEASLAILTDCQVGRQRVA